MDNAVLATMVMDCLKEQREKVLKRNCRSIYFLEDMLGFSRLVGKIWWLKAVGGAYLFICLQVILKVNLLWKRTMTC